jgi:hypothetical protein
MVDFFSRPATPAPQASPTTAAFNAAATNVATADNTKAAATVADVNTPAPAPLDAFKGLWDTTNTSQTPTPTGVLPVLTAEQLSTTLANSNFLQGVNPELMAKATAGDAQAFQDVMNQGLRSVMTQAVLASHGLVEAGARGSNERLKTTLPSMVRSNNVADQLRVNPLFNDPAAKPMIDMVKSQLESKHPQASASEIASMTQEFVSAFARAGNPDQPKEPAKGKTASGDTDWYAVLGL